MQFVLLVGAGSMGKTHLRAYEKMENVQIAGIVDIRTPSLLRLKETEYSFFQNFEEAIDTLERVDVVDICLPTFLHKEFVEKAAKLGKHVICEKPITGSLEDAKSMIETCKANGVQLYIGQVTRFFPEYVRAKELVEAGAIGKPGIIRTTRNGNFPKNAWNDWFANIQSSGGVILDLLIHDFDFLRWCFGEVKRVYAKSLTGREYRKKDYALVTLRFENGVIAHVEGSWAHDGFYKTFEFSGDKGNFEYDSRNFPIHTVIENPLGGEGGKTIKQSPLNESPYYRELVHFIDCIETGKRSIISPEDAYKAVEIALAANKSIQINEPVYLNN